MLNEIHNFISSSGSGTIITYGSGSDFLTSYGSSSGSTSQKVTVPTVPVPVHNAAAPPPLPHPSADAHTEPRTEIIGFFLGQLCFALLSTSLGQKHWHIFTGNY
jgi:hypothetical protein